MRDTEITSAYDASDLKSTLCYIYVHFGREVFFTQGKTTALLSDLAPRLSKERNMVKILDETGILLDLLRASEKSEAEQKKVIQIAQMQLVNDRFITPEMSGGYLSVLCSVFGWNFDPAPTVQTVPSASTAQSCPVTPSVSSDVLSGPTSRDSVKIPLAEIGGNLEVGQQIAFGSYPQANNGSQPIIWKVIDKENTEVLLVSRDILDAQLFSKDDWTTWDTCGLLTWLNDEFFKSAFSASEQGRIVSRRVVTPDNPLYKTYGGSGAECRVAILDVYEAKKMFAKEQDRAAQVTEYAYRHGAYRAKDNKCGLWRLRTPGFNQKMTAVVEQDGSIDYYGDSIGADYVGVRPVIALRYGKVQ